MVQCYLWVYLADYPGCQEYNPGHHEWVLAIGWVRPHAQDCEVVHGLPWGASSSGMSGGAGGGGTV